MICKSSPSVWKGGGAESPAQTSETRNVALNDWHRGDGAALQRLRHLIDRVWRWSKRLQQALKQRTSVYRAHRVRCPRLLPGDVAWEPR